MLSTKELSARYGFRNFNFRVIILDNRWRSTVPTSVSTKFYRLLLTYERTGAFVGRKRLVFRLRRTERVKRSCKSGITSDVTGRITHLAYPDRIVPRAASTPWRLPRPASSSSSSSRHSTTSTTFCLPFTRTAHTLDPLTAGDPLPPSVVTLSRGRCEPALIATPDAAAVLVVDAVVVAAAAALRCHPHRPTLFAVVAAAVAVAVNRHATQPSAIYLVAHLPVVI